MKGDAPQALLVTTTNDGGTATKVIKDLCGMDTYYVQTALVLEVKRTIDPTSTAIGVTKTGKVVQVCDNIEYNTYEREWVDESCSAPSEPGRKDEGWCGYIYLTPGPGTEADPFNLAAGISSFEEVDSSVCETYLAENQCDGSEDTATVNGDGDRIRVPLCRHHRGPEPLDALGDLPEAHIDRTPFIGILRNMTEAQPALTTHQNRWPTGLDRLWIDPGGLDVHERAGEPELVVAPQAA